MDAERRRLQKQHDKDMDELRREFNRKREVLTEQLDDEVSNYMFRTYNTRSRKYIFMTPFRGGQVI